MTANCSWTTPSAAAIVDALRVVLDDHDVTTVRPRDDRGARRRAARRVVPKRDLCVCPRLRRYVKRHSRWRRRALEVLVSRCSASWRHMGPHVPHASSRHSQECHTWPRRVARRQSLPQVLVAHSLGHRQAVGDAQRVVLDNCEQLGGTRAQGVGTSAHIVHTHVLGDGSAGTATSNVADRGISAPSTQSRSDDKCRQGPVATRAASGETTYSGALARGRAVSSDVCRCHGRSSRAVCVDVELSAMRSASRRRLRARTLDAQCTARRGAASPCSTCSASETPTPSRTLVRSLTQSGSVTASPTGGISATTIKLLALMPTVRRERRARSRQCCSAARSSESASAAPTPSPSPTATERRTGSGAASASLTPTWTSPSGRNADTRDLHAHVAVAERVASGVRELNARTEKHERATRRGVAARSSMTRLRRHRSRLPGRLSSSASHRFPASLVTLTRARGLGAHAHARVIAELCVSLAAAARGARGSADSTRVRWYARSDAEEIGDAGAQQQRLRIPSIAVDDAVDDSDAGCERVGIRVPKSATASASAIAHSARANTDPTSPRALIDSVADVRRAPARRRAPRPRRHAKWLGDRVAPRAARLALCRCHHAESSSRNAHAVVWAQLSMSCTCASRDGITSAYDSAEQDARP